ncbi:MAG: hypothetical protein ACXADY_02785 [Candidatus Hodarchaeales archaeon]|jgi:proteasome lid subunit RPN8/RPN11
MTLHSTSFESKKLQNLALRYVKINSEQEVFIGLLGYVKGIGKKGIRFVIRDLIPFPNLNPEPSQNISIPKIWRQVLKEYSNLKYFDQKTRPIGFLHSHIVGTRKPSSEDIQFCQDLATERGSSVMLIANENGQISAYYANPSDFKRIKFIPR